MSLHRYVKAIPSDLLVVYERGCKYDSEFFLNRIMTFLDIMKSSGKWKYLFRSRLLPLSISKLCPDNRLCSDQLIFSKSIKVILNCEEDIGRFTDEISPSFGIETSSSKITNCLIKTIPSPYTGSGSDECGEVVLIRLTSVRSKNYIKFTNR